jgi:hypothetical protein
MVPEVASGGPRTITFGKLTSIALNSAALYVLTYLISHLIVHAAQVATSSYYIIPNIWRIGKLMFRIQDPEWRRSMVVIIFASGQTLCLILAGLALMRLRTSLLKRGLQKLFWAWMLLHLCNQFFGAMAADNFTRAGFWYSPRFLFITSNVPAVAAGFVCSLVCLFIGYKMSLPFLRTCDSITLMQLQNRSQLIWVTVFAPWLIGTVTVLGLKFDDIFQRGAPIYWLELGHLVSIMLLLIPMAVGMRFEMHEMTVEFPRKPKLSWPLIITALLVMGTMRLIFRGDGIFIKPKGYLNYPGREVAERIRLRGG